MPRREPVHFIEQRAEMSRKGRERRTGKWEWKGNCTSRCKLNPSNLGTLTVAVDKMFQSGDSDAAISDQLAEMGYQCSKGASLRHRSGHLYKTEWHDAKDMEQRPGMTDRKMATLGPGEVPEVKPVDNIEALRSIISVGMTKLHTGKISAELVVKAIDLEERLTRGQKTTALMDALMNLDDEDDIEDEEEELVAPSELAVDMAKDLHE